MRVAMKYPACLLVGSLLLAGCATPPAPLQPQQLAGPWKVDLRPTPQADAYFQEFVVSAVKDKTFEGSFYGAPIRQGRINSDWGTLRIAFVTADGSGEYHHSAVLQQGRLEGLTHSIGRGFLAYWSAARP